MRNGFRGELAAALFAVALAPAVARGQVPAPLPEPAPVSRDCSRWPASVYDEASANCVCPAGMWWNLRGDACLPREHAAGEFCSTVWPSSQPLFVANGGYRCVCAPPLLWDAQATGCRPPLASGEEECSVEWPGTLPVLSPSGTEFECRCPGGRRWDDNSRTCVGGAPVIRATRGVFTEPYDPPAPGMREAPVAPGATIPPSAPPTVAPGPARSPGDPIAPGDDGARAVPQAPPGQRPAQADAPPRSTGNATCDALLAEIRARAAAGQPDQADAMGMRAAVAGCDPTAIADAARVPAPR